jgi:hypothetical protein
MILFSGNLNVAATGAGFQPIASVAIPAGMLVEGALRWSISGRRTTGAGTSSLRTRIGGVDLLAPGAGDTSANVYSKAIASAPSGGASLRANGLTSRGGSVQGTGLAAVDLSLAHSLAFEIDLGTDTDVFRFDELTVEYLPPE